MATTTHAPIPFPSDPILLAIDRHREAWNAFIAASPSTVAAACRDQASALANLLTTGCTTDAGAAALLRHLRAVLDANGRTLAIGCESSALMRARARNLALLVEPTGRTGLLPRVAAAAGTASRLAHRIGEVAACLVIVGGGAVLVGLASLH
ncbi:hypothetical protein [Methylobacterium sp. A54F]